jgi:hypothetical protein
VAALFTIAELRSWTRPDLTDAMAELALELVTIDIRRYVGAVRYDALLDLTPLKRVALDYAKRMVRNADGKRSTSRSVDDYTETDTFATETLQPAELTAADEAAIDKALGDDTPAGAFTIRPHGTPDCYVPPLRSYR